MTVSIEVLAERLRAVREQTLTALLEAQAAALNSGAEIEAEPIRRTADGVVRREGPLDLPSRADLLIVTGSRQRHRDYSGTPAKDFAPFAAFDSPEFVARIEPFAWDHAVLHIEGRQDQPNWTPLRHWFLEFFQTRPTELAPDLAGVLHRLDGPWLSAEGWRAIVDFGSAPLDAVPAMIAALATSGCAEVTVTAE